MELTGFSLLVYGLNHLFLQTPKPLMDTKSIQLARAFLLGGLCLIQFLWSTFWIDAFLTPLVLETSQVLGFGIGELFKNMADVVMISGFTLAVSLSDMRELEEF